MSADRTVHHEAFGEIHYQYGDEEWTGRCKLPRFAELGRRAEGCLGEPEADLLNGVFPLSIFVHEDGEPSAAQVKAFRHLIDHEADVCRAVMNELFNCYRAQYGSMWDWAKKHEQSWLVGWLARLLAKDARQTPEDLRHAARCTGVEVSVEHVDEFAYLGFQFATAEHLEVEHGLAVVYHVTQGTFYGDSSAIFM